MEALSGTPRPMAYDEAAVVAHKGPGPCCVRSLNAGDPTLPTSTFLGVSSWSSALSLTSPKSKDPRTIGGIGRGLCLASTLV